jgi:PAS domain S-box-containing protein
MSKRTESRRVDERFRLAVEASPSAMVMVDHEGKIVLANSQTEKLFGYPRQELLGRSIEMLVPEPSRKHHPALRADYSAQPHPQTRSMAEGQDLLAQRKDGSLFPAQIALNPIETKHGTWVLSSIVDITERHRALEHFRLALESLPGAKVMADHLGKIVLVNSQAEKLFGYSRQELLGQTIEMLVPESSRENHPALREDFFTHPKVRPMGAGRDLHAQHKSGKLIPVEIALNPIQTEQGTWVLSSIVDITERQQAVAALRESEERFRNMADTAPVLIWISGPDKRCTFFNQGWLRFTGRTMEQELGNGWSEGVHPDDLDRCIAIYSTSFDARRPFLMEYRIRRADGEYRWVLDHGVPRFAPGGDFAGYIGTCADITEVKLTLEAALASQKLESVGQLAGGIAHDFNNLLGGILASAELALSELAEGSSPVEELERIRTAAVRGGEIVGQLMIYSGKEGPAFELTDLSSLVAEMLHLLKISISKHAVLKIELGERLPAMYANAAQIRQIVMNLVTNASEAIGERDGVVRVVTSRTSGAECPSDGDYLKLEVSDTGAGMPPEVQARIFDPFFTTKFTGRGLGLATVQGIIRAHAGTIRVDSSPGQGTRIVILLPCTDQVAVDTRETAAHAPTRNAGPTAGTVLMVEDEESLRQPVAKLLRGSGFCVIEAGDGATAVELFRANASKITVVLLDMTLPGRNGPEVFVELCRIRPGVRVILTSAYSEETFLSAIEGHPVTHFVRKPYALSDLMNLIRDVCVQKNAAAGISKAR